MKTQNLTIEELKELFKKSSFKTVIDTCYESFLSSNEVTFGSTESTMFIHSVEIIEDGLKFTTDYITPFVGKENFFKRTLPFTREWEIKFDTIKQAQKVGESIWIFTNVAVDEEFSLLYIIF